MKTPTVNDALGKVMLGYWGILFQLSYFYPYQAVCDVTKRVSDLILFYDLRSYWGMKVYLVHSHVSVSAESQGL